ncbi:hypothetical protein HMPREF0496_1861 [Lentilactobacillus hilgardii ATCC 27305]|nr:hypothetical protein HMPREF0496_1861 [Lentilactobacillus hilgardii ATCC 27305]
MILLGSKPHIKEKNSNNWIDNRYADLPVQNILLKVFMLVAMFLLWYVLVSAFSLYYQMAK